MQVRKLVRTSPYVLQFFQANLAFGVPWQGAASLQQTGVKPLGNRFNPARDIRDQEAWLYLVSEDKRRGNSM